MIILKGGAVPEVIEEGTKIFRMPGGEWHITPLHPLIGRHWAYVQPGSQGNELLGLAVWADAVHHDGGEPIAIMPYLPGARQDRYHPGEALTAKVYADIINSCRLSKIVCLDPHSDVMPALLDNCVVVPPDQFVKEAIGDIQYRGVIAPDAGASKRAESVANTLGVPLYHAWKHRDSKTGKLSGFSCETLPSDGRLLVVDDICDGGRTFVGLAKATKIPFDYLDLWVTHGVFSSGAENLLDSFWRLYTTNSHESQTPGTRDYIHPRLKTIKVFDTLARLVC